MPDGSLPSRIPEPPGQPALPLEGETLAGWVERITYHDPESGFCVLRLKVQGHRGLIPLTGRTPAVAVGEVVTARGRWEQHPAHGKQFRADLLRVMPPTTLEGVEKYLASGLVRGVGPAYARKLIDAFGAAVLQVIEQEPARIAAVPGIGPKRAAEIAQSWAEQAAIREIMLFLQSHGVGTARAVRIFRTYGAEAVQLVTEDPYRLARDVAGIGFRTADEIAGRLGIDPQAPVRAQAGIVHVLREAVADGHCALPEDELLLRAERLLGIPRAGLEAALAATRREGTAIADTIGGVDCVFLASLWLAEQQIARRLPALATGATPWPPVHLDAATAWAEKALGATLSASQRSALGAVFGAKVSVITGGPGVGKTTIVRALLSVLAEAGLRVALCAPTGRAAKRLAEATGRPAKTIHRLLEPDPATGEFRRHEANPLEADLLVVDEASMVDVPLMAALLRAVPGAAGLVLVGDVDQLPSVGPGQVLSDVIAAGGVAVARLTEIFRQAEASAIVVSAHGIRDGRTPTENGRDFFVVPAEDDATAIRRLVAMVTTRMPQAFGLDAKRDIQVLCPTNRGPLGSRALNHELQAALNGDAALPSLSRFGWTFRLGDKVMQTDNDYEREVFNGDIGVVTAVDTAENRLAVAFDGREVEYGLAELDQLQLAYATSVHKAQGSEYPAVVMPVSLAHGAALRRSLIYTGVTRGRALVVLVGQARALRRAVEEGAEPPRWTKLRERLAARLPLLTTAGRDAAAGEGRSQADGRGRGPAKRGG
ncbi:MAG TPA: ATP-dependent RecD-like DNA helicase [Alphaproteobacteria bacterium]|nr:ATP-dependent RecD-like DNA helicase [Alphaproteobacteria bacterium]